MEGERREEVEAVAAAADADDADADGDVDWEVEQEDNGGDHYPDLLTAKHQRTTHHSGAPATLRCWRKLLPFHHQVTDGTCLCIPDPCLRTLVAAFQTHRSLSCRA